MEPMLRRMAMAETQMVNFLFPIKLKRVSGRMSSIKRFTPLESPAACSGDEPRKTSGLLRGEDIIPFRANTGFNAPCEHPRWKVEDFLTGFTISPEGLSYKFTLPVTQGFSPEYSL